VYNYLISTTPWTKWVKNIRSGHMLSTDRKLYLCHYDDAYLLQERKSFSLNFEDYMDEDIAVIVTAKGTTGGKTYIDVTYTYAGTTLSSGWLFQYVTGGVESKVSSVTTLGATSFRLVLADLITTLPTVPFSAAVNIPIDSEVLYTESGNTVGLTKNYMYAQLYYESEYVSETKLGFFTNRESDEETITIAGTISSGLGWGDMTWGSDPWGSASASTSIPKRVFVPKQHRMAEELNIRFSHKIAKETFNIMSMAITMRPATEVTARVR
jgi:hypothetical protein